MMRLQKGYTCYFAPLILSSKSLPPCYLATLLACRSPQLLVRDHRFCFGPCLWVTSTDCLAMTDFHLFILLIPVWESGRSMGRMSLDKNSVLEFWIALWIQCKVSRGSLFINLENRPSITLMEICDSSRAGREHDRLSKIRKKHRKRLDAVALSIVQFLFTGMISQHLVMGIILYFFFSLREANRWSLDFHRKFKVDW